MGGGKLLSRVMPAGTFKQSRDATANDSDKVMLTVPANKRVRLLHLSASLNATATVGNRSLIAWWTDGTNDIMAVFAQSANITASTTGVGRAFPNATDTGSNARVPTPSGQVVAFGTQSPNPDVWVPAGWVLRVMDVNAVDAAADDLTVVLHYEELDV